MSLLNVKGNSSKQSWTAEDEESTDNRIWIDFVPLLLWFPALLLSTYYRESFLHYESFVAQLSDLYITDKDVVKQ